MLACRVTCREHMTQERDRVRALFVVQRRALGAGEVEDRTAPRPEMPEHGVLSTMATLGPPERGLR
jgi:hypothetical protein